MNFDYDQTTSKVCRIFHYFELLSFIKSVSTLAVDACRLIFDELFIEYYELKDLVPAPSPPFAVR